MSNQKMLEIYKKRLDTLKARDEQLDTIIKQVRHNEDKIEFGREQSDILLHIDVLEDKINVLKQKLKTYSP